MTVDLMVTSDDPRKVSKTTATYAEGVKTLSPTTAVDLMTPVFCIDYNEGYLNCNYLYCREMRRYYYVDNRRVDVGKRLYLICRVDPLMSHGSQIRNCKACVVRSESVGKPTFIKDSSLPIHPSKVKVTSYGFSSTPFVTDSQYAYVLTVTNSEQFDIPELST